MEFAWLRKIEFFPSPISRAEDWEGIRSICIATKSRNLGDALSLTTLPAKLKRKHPHLRIYTYPRAFNPYVFIGNPAVSGIQRLPRAVYGDDCNWGQGQLIQLKEQFFDLPVSEPPRPEIHLLEEERRWGTKLLRDKQLPGNEAKPLIVIHPWGTTRSRVATVEFWDELVRRHQGRFRFWQVGVEGHGAVQGCEYYLFLRKRVPECRKLFAVLAGADAFIGVDSGPMHAARAFNLPSLILVNHVDPAQAFTHRKEAPYFLKQNWKSSFLYEENTHVSLTIAGEMQDSAQGRSQIYDQIDAFIHEKVSKLPHAGTHRPPR